MRCMFLFLFGVLLVMAFLPVGAQSPDWVWIRRYVYDLRFESGELVATDRAGNVYVAGYTRSGTDWGSSVLLLKYSAEGNLLWQRTYSPVSPRPVTPVDMEIDAAGNVYLLVRSQYFGSFLLLKFDSDGNLLWSQSYAGPRGDFSSRNVPYVLALDHAGNVYAAGTSEGYWSGPDITLLKYTASGQPQWVRRYSANLGASSDSEAGTAVACDAEGNIYVAGWARPTYSLHEWIVLKYNPRGDLLWVWREPFDVTSSYVAYAPLQVLMDNSGELYVAGDVQGACVALKLSPTGNRLWRREFTVSNVTLQLGGAERDSAGNLWIVGFGNRLTVTHTAVQAVYKVSPGGLLLWSAQDEAPAVMQSIDGSVMAPSDQLWVVGTRSQNYSDRTILLWQWNTQGQLVRQVILPSSPHLANWAADIAADEEGNVVIAGYSDLLYYSTSDGPGADALVAKFGTGTGVTLQGRVILSDIAIRFPALPVEVELRQNGVVVRRDEVYLDENGYFTLYNAPEGVYDVAFRGMHWLRRVVPQVTIAPGAPEVEVYLINGDIDGDNEVTLFDFGLLVQAFGSSPGEAHWNINADLDMDAEVTLFDFAVIVFRFGEIGDE
ncbi:MAG: hypothetical protein KatS3mg022_1100 [Armatimonadota bacterium]|nr:MAG: hypothetical protein KatS3mg022_1100 [Armatimonadota bacterium]